MLARVADLVIHVGHHAHVLEEGPRCLVARVGRRRHVGHVAPFQVLNRLDEDFGPLAEILFEPGALPVEGQERLAHLLLQLRRQVVDVPVGGPGELVRLPDNADLRAVENPPLDHAQHHGGGDGGGLVVPVHHPHDGVVVLARVDDLVVHVGHHAHVLE